MRRRVVCGLAAAAAMCAPAIAPAAASAALKIDGLSTTPASTQAGSHPNFTMALRFSGDSTPKSMRIQLPPGFVGNPNATAKCAQATFGSGGCGNDSVVGSTTVHVAIPISGGGGGLPNLPELPGGGGGGGGNPICNLLPILCPTSSHRLMKPPRGVGRPVRRKGQKHLSVPITAPGTVYNLQPSPGEPARLGIEVRPVAGTPIGAIRLQSPVAVRDGSDFGLTSTLDDLPSSFSGLPTQITGMDLTLLGRTASGASFVTLPTSCAPATTRVQVTPYSGGADTATASFTPTGCGAVPFTPALDVVPDTTRIDSTSGYSIRLGVPGEDEPIRQAHVSEARVTLPLGTALNPGTAVGLEVCTDAQFGQGSSNAPGCPAASVVGTTSFTSPLVGTLTGTVYEGAPKPGQMLRLFVDVPGPGLRIKLVGTVDPDPRTGQITSTFANLPQLPFTAFALNFRGGDRAILVTPPACGPAVSKADLTPHSGTGAVETTSRFNVNWDGAGTPCPDPLPFSPAIGATVDPSTAGGPTTAVTTIARKDRTQRMKDMAISFPPGLVGGLGNGIGLCEIEKARAAKCPPESRVGSASLVAGPGAAPLQISGDVFLTAPIDGSLAGLAITVPGKVGPFDLGTTVSFARIVARPSDSGLDVTANGLPQIVGGIPLALRQIRLTLDRKGFMRNGTSCQAQQLTATFTSTLGATAQATAPYRSTGCDSVRFAPKLAGVVGSRRQLARGANPSITALVTQRDGEIAARSVKVTLPKELAVDMEALGVTCPEGRDCGERNTVGSATAVTPLLPIPLTGPVKLVTPKEGGLPILRLQLSGLLSIDLTGRTALTKDGRVENTFEGIPDVPLSRFELTLKGGPSGILQNVRRLRCGEKLRGDGEFVGHNGARKAVTGSFEVCGTLRSAAGRSAASATARLRKGRLVLTVRGTRKVTALRVRLPKGMRVQGRRGFAVKAPRPGARLAVAGRRAVRVTKLSSKRVRVVAGKRAVRGAGKAKRRGRAVVVRVSMGRTKAALKVRIR